MSEQKCHLSVGNMHLTRGKFDIKVYKPNQVESPSDNPVLFCNYNTETTYEYHEHELINANFKAEKFIIDVTYDNKSVCIPVFEYMKSKYMFTNENIVDDSIVVGQDNIIKALSVLYDDKELIGCIKETIINIIKTKYNLSDDDFNAITSELESINEIA